MNFFNGQLCKKNHFLPLNIFRIKIGSEINFGTSVSKHSFDGWLFIIKHVFFSKHLFFGEIFCVQYVTRKRHLEDMKEDMEKICEW